MMQLPDWATDDVRRDAMNALATYDLPEDFSQAGLTPVENFSGFFAEWMFKGDDLLLHLFPRDGAGDKWYPEKYVDGHYVPGRREEKATASFPKDMVSLLQDAAVKIWLGDIAVDPVPELGAYSVQFQGAKNTVKLVNPGKFVDKFCGELDTLLE